MTPKTKGKKGDPIGAETLIPLKMLVHHFGTLPKFVKARPEIVKLISLRHLRRLLNGENAGDEKIERVRPALERLAKELVPGFPKPAPSPWLDIHKFALGLIQECASPSRIHEHAVHIYHKGGRPDDALRLIKYILQADYARKNWQWEDQCTVIGVMMHIAKRSSDPTTALCEVLEYRILPLLNDPKLPDRTGWHEWLVYIGGQLLELLGETPNAHRDPSRSTLIRELADRLYWQIRLKNQAGCTLSDLNQAFFNVASMSLLDSTLHYRANRALRWSNELSSLVHENHQAAYRLRAIESAIARNRESKLEEHVQQLKDKIDVTMKQLQDSANDRSGTFKVSPITFGSACVHYILAIRRIDRGKEASITENLEEFWREYARAKGTLAAKVSHRVHISPVLHNLVEISRNRLLAEFLHPNCLPNSQPTGDSRLTQLLALAASTLLQRMPNTPARIVVIPAYRSPSSFQSLRGT